MMKKEDARKWLLVTVKLAGGPSRCTKRTVLNGKVLATIKGFAYNNFGDELTLEESTTFGKLLKIIKGNISRMKPYRAVILQKKES